MSRSNPPRSSIAARLRQSSRPIGPTSTSHRPLTRRLGIRFAKLMRWLHIYLSMFGLAVVLFFSVTGITLNHPQWFYAGAERRKSAEGTIDADWLKGPSAVTTSETAEGAADRGEQVKKLEIVEYFRKAHAIAGALAEFRVDESECLVSFKGPGYAADAFIDRPSGHYNLTETYHGFVAVLNDLHKGRDTGPVWSVVIDVSAGLMTLISLSGLVLLFYLKLRRVSGLVVALVGGAVAIALYRWWVP
jgi:uncharacterized protein